MDFNRGWGNVFHQREFDEAFEFLTCCAIDDITVPEGDVTIKKCPDPNRSGDFMATSSIVGDAGPPTMSLVRPLRKVYNHLMETECPAQYRLNWACRGDRTVVYNYSVGFLLLYGRITNRGIPTPSVLEPSNEDRVETNADATGLDSTLIYQLTGDTQPNTFTQAINDMVFLAKQCEDICGERVGLGEIGYAVMDAAGYMDQSEVEVGITKDGGANWAAVAGEPFGATYTHNLLCVEVKETSDGHRVLTGREGVAGTDPQIAYSDDEGATWTQVSPTGCAHGQAVNDLEKDLTGALWACGDDGYIWKSTDVGNSWTAQEEGVETVQDLNAMAFVTDAMFKPKEFGVAVGDSNAYLYTSDGGENWSAGTGPAVGVNLLSVDINKFGHIYVGTNDARLFRSTDEGDNWTEVLDKTAGSIDYIHFDPYMNYFGALCYNTASPVGTVYRTEDGGASWYTDVVGTTPTNQGINVVRCVGPNMIYAGGELLAGGTPFIAKFDRRS